MSRHIHLSYALTVWKTSIGGRRGTRKQCRDLCMTQSWFNVHLEIQGCPMVNVILGSPSWHLTQTFVLIRSIPFCHRHAPSIDCLDECSNPLSRTNRLEPLTLCPSALFKVDRSSWLDFLLIFINISCGYKGFFKMNGKSLKTVTHMMLTRRQIGHVTCQSGKIISWRWGWIWSPRALQLL